MIGHRLLGTSYALLGDPTKARAHLERALSLYDPNQHRPLATRFGQDLAVVALNNRSEVLWALGYPDAALADVDQAFKYAREIGHATTLLYALTYLPLTHIFCGNYATAKELVDEGARLAVTLDASFWKATSMMMHGQIMVLTGEPSDAIQTITSALKAYQSTGATHASSVFLTALASAYAQLGQFDDASRCIGEAETIAVTKERAWESEVNRMVGEIALLSPEPDTAKAEAYFERALAVAREQQAKSWELRAAMSMARLWHDQGKRDQARDLLAPVYGWFTEGFDTRDLKEAKALLDELAA
jgi:predicted ATPase